MELESVWTLAGGYKIHARTAGPPETRSGAVVLVHGLVVSSRYMVPTARILARDSPVFAPDLPGFGRSEKPDHVLNVPELADALAAWIRESGLDRPVLLANSLGCQIAADLALRHPGLVGALVLVGPTVDPEARAAAQQIWRFLRLIPKEPLGYWPMLALDFARAGIRRTYFTFRHMLRDRIERALPHLRMPALVVRGGRDPIVPQRWAERAAELLPDGRLLVVPKGVHIVNYDAAEALVRAIRPFLETWGSQR